MRTKLERSDFQSQLRLRMAETLDALKMKNPSYSLRAFAGRLGLSPSAVSEMLKGKRSITRKTAERLIERLNLSPLERNKLALQVARAQKSDDLSQREYVQVEMDHYHLISDWYYFAVLSLAETSDFQDDPAWIAKRLNLPLRDSRRALERLERLKLLVRGPGGKLAHSGAAFKTSSNIAHASLRKSHFENLHLATRSLEKDAVEIRDFSSITMAIDPELLPEAKNMIRDFRRALCALLESGNKHEVYKINVQLFPLTLTEEK